MNIATLALVTVALQGQTQSPLPSTSAEYKNDEFGLQFSHPKSWKQSKIKVKNTVKFEILDPKTWRPARTDNTTKFLIPLPGVNERGVLEVYPVDFHSEADIWQASIRDINDNLAPKRTMLRQWQEELLGVPLLMSKIQSSDKGVPLLTETGLLYSNTPRKMAFRLTASPDNFDKADAEWRTAMQSVRTIDGSLPNREDPDKPTQAERNPGGYHKVIWMPPTQAAFPAIKGEVSTEMTAAGKKVLLRSPAGWKVSKNADGSAVISSPLLSKSAKVSLLSSIDSDPPAKALLRASSQSLDGFTKVAKRDERGPTASRAQCQVIWISREGLATGKPYYTFDAVGSAGDFYWLINWSSNDSGSYAKDSKELTNLVEALSVEPAP